MDAISRGPAALDDLRVVDLSDTLAGQYCGRLFADYGAEVILIEPRAGSAVRRMPPFSTEDPEVSLRFWHLNTQKRSFCLDRGVQRDDVRLESLLATADVAILPGDLDPSIIERRHPRCIAVAITAFGQCAALAGWKGPEIVLQAMSGMMNNNGAHGREPLYGVGERASLAAGLAAFIGALVALQARGPNGWGQAVRVDAAETAAAMAFPYVLRHFYNGSVHSRRETAMPAGQVRCQDGWVCIWIYNHRWAALCATLGLPMLEHDTRFADPIARRENWDALFAVIQEKVAGRNAEELVDQLQAAQVIAAKAWRLHEQVNSRHLRERGFWENAAGRRILGPPFRLSRTPRRIRTGSPRLGESGDGEGLLQQRNRPRIASRVTNDLSHLRVIEITTAWAGPMAGRILSYFGAETIHIESPGRVDSWRLNREKPNPVNFPEGVPGRRPFDRSFLFNSQNVNKLSCIVDLKTSTGREILQRLAAVADILICNFRPGTLARLGLDYGALARIKPDIIVAELPAFGLNGPMAQHAALGPTMEMATGMAAMIGYRDGRPESTGPSYLDPIGGFNAAAAILTALHYRQRTGEGQFIEIPQVEAAMQLIGPELLLAAESGSDPAPDGNRVLTAAPHDAFPAQGEDQWLVIAAQDDSQWQALCEAIGQLELAKDPRFATLPDRKANEDLLTAMVSAWTRHQDKHEAAALLQRAGVAAAPVTTAADLAASPYLACRGFFTELDHPDAGRHPHPGLPFHLSRTPGAQRRAAPRFGEHNLVILRDILGLSPEEIDRIAASGAMATQPHLDG